MIDLDKLKNVKRLVTHANCPDGIASALIVKDALPDVEVLFVKHGTEQHRTLEPRPGTLFVDFSPYSKQGSEGMAELRAREWIENGAIVLDHHPTQRDVTMKFVEAGLGAYGENDRGECGAWLAYEHVWRPIKLGHGPFNPHDDGESVKQFAELAGVRDTWKKDDPRWWAACEQAEALMFWPFEMQTLDFLNSPPSGIANIGKVLFQKKLEHARTAIGESHRFDTIKGTRVIVFQGVTPTSDVAEIIEKKEKERASDRRGGVVPWSYTDIVAGFHYRVDAGRLQLQFSTRSHTGYDVGAFCKSKGGGGHHAAAGFTIEQSAEVGANPYAVFRLLLEEWEQGQ